MRTTVMKREAIYFCIYNVYLIFICIAFAKIYTFPLLCFTRNYIVLVIMITKEMGMICYHVHDILFNELRFKKYMNHVFPNEIVVDITVYLYLCIFLQCDDIAISLIPACLLMIKLLGLVLIEISTRGSGRENYSSFFDLQEITVSSSSTLVSGSDSSYDKSISE